MHSVTVARVVRFGPFSLDTQTEELRKGETRLRLHGQPVRLLIALLTRPGEVVTREELQETLWPGDTFVDFDHSINSAVRKLRSALDDSAETPRFIETLARKGYRFVAPVEWDAPAASPPPAQPFDGLPARPERTAPFPSRRWIMTSAAIVVLAMVGLLALRMRRTAPPAAEQPRGIRSIAVLPIANPDHETEYVSDGLTESLIDAISSPDLRVIGWTSVSRYKKPEIDPRAAGKELNAGAVVTGRLARGNNAYELDLEMVDVSDGAQLWSGRYNGTESNLDLLRRRAIADLTLRLGVTRADRREQRASPAYDDYLHGRYLWNKRHSRDSLMRSIDYFERAIDLDPKFAPAYAGLCQAWGVLHGYRWMPGQERETQEKATAAGEKAIALDDTLAEAHTCLGGGKENSWQWDFAGAEQEFRRAITLNPNYATAHQWYAHLLETLGRHEEARREVDIAWQLDPFSSAIAGAVCWQRFNQRRYDEAIEFVKRAGESNPTLYQSNCLASAYMITGQFEEGVEILAKWNEKDGRKLIAAMESGGPPALFKTMLELSLEDTASRGYLRAGMYTAVGDADGAFAELEKAFEQRETNLAMFYEDPRLDPIRKDPRFDALARKIGLPQVRQPLAISH